MKTQLHLHTSRYSGCAIHTPEMMLQRAIQKGFQSVFITEHDAVWPTRELQDIRRQFPALQIWPGLELTVLNDMGASHLLILGTNARDFLQMEDSQEILAEARRRQCPTILAHPFRWEGAEAMLAGPLRPDGIEYHTPNHPPAMAEVSREHAEALSLPLINSDDAHSKDMIGRYWIETHRPFRTPRELRAILLGGYYENRGELPENAENAFKAHPAGSGSWRNGDRVSR
jgi:hypothetical protein